MVTSRLTQKYICSLAGGKRKKPGEGDTKKAEKDTLEWKLSSRNTYFSSHFLLKQTTANQLQLLILNNGKNPNFDPASERFEKGAGGTGSE
eukprot:7212255-Ditylum_brightwellii.AAC.1